MSKWQWAVIVVAGFCVLGFLFRDEIRGGVAAGVNAAKKSRTSEASSFLRKMMDSARTYYVAPNNGGGLGAAGVPKQFPQSSELTPSEDCCQAGGKCNPSTDEWYSDTWKALDFQMKARHYYRYEFTSSGSGEDATATGRAIGDLGCDGNIETWEATLRIVDGEVVTSEPKRL